MNLRIRVLLVVAAALGLLFGAQATLLVDHPLSITRACKSTRISPWPPIYQFYDPANISDSIYASGRLVSARDAFPVDRNRSIVVYDFEWKGVDLVDDLLRFQRQGAAAVVLSTSFCTALNFASL